MFLRLTRVARNGCLGNTKRWMSFSYPAPRALNEITNLPLLELEDADTVKKIWKVHHQEQSTSISGTLSGAQYEMLESRAASSPFFVFPVPRDEGHFILLSQAQGKHFLYTFLEDYKNNPETATPYLSLTFYDDFKDTKDLVLARGDISDMLKKPEAERIMEFTTSFYLDNYEEIESFNHTPDKFDFVSHIENCLTKA